MSSYAKVGKFGISFSFMSPVNFSIARISLKSALKGPQYEMKAVAREQLPTSLFFSSEI